MVCKLLFVRTERADEKVLTISFFVPGVKSRYLVWRICVSIYKQWEKYEADGRLLFQVLYRSVEIFHTIPHISTCFVRKAKMVLICKCFMFIWLIIDFVKTVFWHIFYMIVNKGQ